MRLLARLGLLTLAACASRPSVGSATMAPISPPREVAPSAPPGSTAGPLEVTPPPSPAPASIPLADRVSPAPEDAIVESLFESGVVRAWRVAGTLLLLTERGRPAVEHEATLPFPPSAREAAIGGRVVTMAEVWIAAEGTLTRVLQRPIGLRPMVCEFDEGCALVDVVATVTPAGGVRLGGGSCATALVRAKPTGAATAFDRYDAAVIPAICRGRGHYALLGGMLLPAAEDPQPAATWIAPDDVGATLLDTILGASISGAPPTTWIARDGTQRLAAFVRSHPAPAHPFFAHEPGAAAWESGRSIVALEVWSASYGSLRRVLRVPIGLSALAEPLSVVRLSLAIEGDEVKLGPLDAPCRADSGFSADVVLTPLEADHARRDAAGAARICAGRGTYRFDGRTFVRAP